MNGIQQCKALGYSQRVIVKADILGRLTVIGGHAQSR